MERTEEGRVPKLALWYRPKGRRDPDRPRRRWNSYKPEQANGLTLELQNKKKQLKRYKGHTHRHRIWYQTYFLFYETEVG
jgi:hypothetical protein